ncbi:hypothetical protein MEQU1_001887 [Malassezia equina]|uniref:FAD/NAD(P)-binding domain-containing protein n=1 Tax=Malassezia equina TaxID=1381935 RepID=A0AAF0IYR3_9BASI|nr:hypothetical protein MEQU1_001887 [Malassezia equina]
MSGISGDGVQNVLVLGGSYGGTMERAIIEDHNSLVDTKSTNERAGLEVADVSDLVQGLDVKDDKTTSDDPYLHAEPHLFVCGEILDIHESYVTVRQHGPTLAGMQAKGFDQDASSRKHLWSIDAIRIPYSHLIYALGSHMPEPLRRDSYTKKEGVSWMQTRQQRIQESKEIIIVGGGALGVELATDIKSLANREKQEKKVTLIHSRQQLLPNFDQQIHEVALKRLKELGVHVVLGHRLAMTEGCPMGSTITPMDKGTISDAKPTEGITSVEGSRRQRIRTNLGLELECDLLLLCTGQQPNSEIMAKFSPSSVSRHSRLVRVLPSLQVMVPQDDDALQQPFDTVPPCKDCDCFLDKKSAGASMDMSAELGGMPAHFPHIYAIGDVADAFGALNAGYQAWFMAEVAVENILRDILRVKSTDEMDQRLSDDQPVPLKHFQPGPPLLKLSLGLNVTATQGAPQPDESKPDKPVRPTVTVSEEPEDMNVALVWKSMANMDPSDMTL